MSGEKKLLMVPNIFSNFLVVFLLPANTAYQAKSNPCFEILINFVQ
jgi:hypothetical protein